MAGQVSIPVKNRSGRVFAAAGLAALIVAMSQWAHWMGLADWDLLSLIPGFAQATNLTANQYPGENGFECANKSIGSEASLMSDELKQTVGQALCSRDVFVEAATLRGADGRLTLRTWKSNRRVSRNQYDRMSTPILRAALVEPKRITLASIDHKRVEQGRDLLDDLDRRARRSELTSPVEPVDDTKDDDHDKPIDEVDLGDDDHSGPGHDGSDDRDEDHDDDDNSGPGGGDSDDDDNSGSTGDSDEFETAEEDHSGSGSDGNQQEDDGDDDNSGSASGDDGGDDDDSDDGDDEDGNSGSGSSNSGSGHS